MENEDGTIDRMPLKGFQANEFIDALDVQRHELIDALDRHGTKQAQRIENFLVEMLQAHEQRMTDVVQAAVQNAWQSSKTSAAPLSDVVQAVVRNSKSKNNDKNKPRDGEDDLFVDIASDPSKDIHVDKAASTPNEQDLQMFMHHPSEVARVARTHSRQAWNESQHSSCMNKVREILYSYTFGNIIGFIILFNTVIIAYQTEHMAKHADEPMPAWLHGLDLIITIIFLVEVSARILADQRGFFTGRQRGWNLFDLFSVAAALMEEFLRGIKGAMVIRVLRILRLVKVMRVFRTLRIFGDLRAMIQGITSSLVAVASAMSLLLLIMFVFALFLTQMVTYHIDNDDPPLDVAVVAALRDNFGSLGNTMYSLYKGITGGDDWSTFADPLFEASMAMGCTFCFYIAFTVLAVLNVVTGVFVDHAMQNNANDADNIIMEQTSQRKKLMKNVKSVFQKADVDGSGTLTESEFEKHIKDVSVQAYFRQLDLDMEGHEACQVFEMLDFDGNGTIDIDEFIGGCARLKGMARSLDLAHVEHTLSKQIASLFESSQQCCLNLNTMSQAIFELRSEMQHGKTYSGSTSAITTADDSKIALPDSGTPEIAKSSTPSNKKTSTTAIPILPGSVQKHKEVNDSLAVSGQEKACKTAPTGLSWRRIPSQDEGA